MLNFNWCNTSSNLEIKSQKLKKSKLKNFVNTNLLLNSISFNKSNKIYCNYLDENESYQILVFENEFDESYLEVFNTFENSNKFTLFIHIKYFLVYKESKPYYFQKRSHGLTNEELKEFIENKFSISIDEIINVSDEDLLEGLKKYKQQKNKPMLLNINETKDYFFSIYSLYILFIVGGLTYLIYMQNIENKIEPIKEVKKEKIFYSFEDKYDSFLKTFKSNKLKVVQLNYEKNIVKISFNSKEKKLLYSFLQEYKKNVLKSAITYLENEKIYLCEVSLKM